MRYYAVNSDPETPLVGSSYIALSQEDFTTCEVVSEADLPSRATNDHQGPSTQTSAFSGELIPQSSHPGTHVVSPSLEGLLLYLVLIYLTPGFRNNIIYSLE